MNRSAPLRLPTSRLILAFGLSFALQGCATQPTGPTITVPSVFREACAPATSKLLTLGDLGVLSVRQLEALRECNARRVGLVEIIDGANAAVKPKRFGVF